MERLKNMFGLGKFGKGKKSFKESPDFAPRRSLAYELKDRDLGKLHKAASVGDVDKLVNLIYKQKKDINKVDRQQRTALHIACSRGHGEVVQFLAKARADLNLRDGENRTALMKAVQSQDEWCVSVLLENHADVDLVDVDGNTALHLAASSDSVSIAWLLLRQDADINALNHEGQSPLSMAAGHEEMTEFLLENGADANATDNSNEKQHLSAASHFAEAGTSHGEPASDMDDGEASQAEEDLQAASQEETAFLKSTESEIEPGAVGGKTMEDFGKGETDDLQDTPDSDSDSNPDDVECNRSLGSWEYDDDIYLEIPSRKTKTQKVGGNMMEEFGIGTADDVQDKPDSDTNPEMNTPASEETAFDSNKLPVHGEEINQVENFHYRAEMASESDDDIPAYDAFFNIPEPDTFRDKERDIIAKLGLRYEESEPESAGSDYEELPIVKNEREVRKSNTDGLENNNSCGSFRFDDDTEYDSNIIQQNIIAKRNYVLLNYKRKMQIAREKSMEEFVIEDIDDSDFVPETLENRNSPVSESGADEPSPNTSTLLSSLQEKEISTDKDKVNYLEDVDLQESEQVLDVVSNIPETYGSKDRNRAFSYLGLVNEESEQESAEYDSDPEEDTFPQDHKEAKIVYEEEMTQVEHFHYRAETDSESDADEPCYDAFSTIPEPDTSRDKNRDFKAEPESSGSDYEEELPLVKNEREVRKSNTEDLEDASDWSSDCSSEDDLPLVRRKFSPYLPSFSVAPQESLRSRALPRETEITARKPHSHEDSDGDTDCPSDNEMMEEVDKGSCTSEPEQEEEPEVFSSTTDVSEGRMLKEKENENLLPSLSFNSSPLLQQRETASQKPQSHEDSDGDTDCPSDNEILEELYKRKSDNDPMERGHNDPISPETRAATTLESEPEVISSTNDVSDDEGTALKEEKENENSEEEEFICEDLTRASDTTADELDSASSFVQKPNLRALDPTHMIQLQNILREYESTIQGLMNENSDLSDKVNQLEMDNVDLKNSLDEVREIQPTLELQTEVVNLKHQLKQEQEGRREVTEAYNTTQDKLQRTEEQRQLEMREKQKMEATLRDRELEMRTLVTNAKQLEEETGKLSETLKLLAQKSGAQTLQDDLLNSHPDKQQEGEDGELQQPTSTLQEQMRNLRGDVERLQANSSLRESHLLKENETLKEELQEAQRIVKANSETAFNCKQQLSTLKSEQMNRFENEKQARETLEKEVDSTRALLATAVQEAERCTAAKADAETCLLRERKERQSLTNRLAADQASHREEVSNLSLQLSKAECEKDSLEREQSRITLQLAEKELFLDALQKDKECVAVQVETLDKALQSHTELLANTGACHEATQEQLARAQGDAMFLRQRLDEANNRCEVKEQALADAQREFTDELSKVRFDCGEKVTLVEGRYKKLARKTADLQDQVLKLEEEKACALKDMDKLKENLTEKDEELAISDQTLQELQSASSASTATVKRLEEAVQRSEIKHSTVERLQANSSLRESHLLKENETLKEELQEAQRIVKANSETAFNCKQQLSTLKSEQTNRFENEKQARETLEKEVDSTRALLATAVQEAERCTAAKADAEKCLLRERKERQSLTNRLAADQASHREEVSNLSLQLSKAECEKDSLEREQSRITLQLAEKELLLDALQKDKECVAVQVETLDKALQSHTELLANTGACHEATQEQLARAQGDAMFLRQRLDEANNRCEVKEQALADAQREFTDELSKVRFDCGEKVTLVEGRYKKLARKTADLQGQVLKLEEEKACALKDMDKLKENLTEKEEELAISDQTLQELQSASSASTATVKRLEEAVQRSEIKHSTVEDCKMQLERMKKTAKKVLEQKTNAEARLDQEKNANSELQREIHSLRVSLKTAEEKLNDRDTRGDTKSTMEDDFRMQLERMKKTAKKVLEQKTNAEARLDREKNANSELKKQIHSLRVSLKTAEERLDDRDTRGETHSSMNLDARKAQNLQILLERETLRRRQLEKDVIILGEESASLKRSEQGHLDKLQELRRRLDFTQREHSQSEERTRFELQYKLEQVKRGRIIGLTPH